MEEKNMTALVSCFVRAYHFKNNKYKIFSDKNSVKMLSEREYNLISINMANGIKFFNPNFVGNSKAALKWIVDNQLSPSVLGRSVFCEKLLINSIRLGCNQYVIYASGYDTLAYKNIFSGINVFEIDKKEIIQDKKNRLKNSGINYSNVSFIISDFTNLDWKNDILKSEYNKNKISFNSLLGISYYLTKNEFKNMINSISNIVYSGSSIIFDYPTYDESFQTKINEKLASGAKEEMKTKYSYKEVERLLSDNDFLIYEHLNNNEMTNQYFNNFNTLNPQNKIKAPKGVAYCLAVKR